MITDQTLIAETALVLESLFTFSVEGSVYIENYDMLMESCKKAFMSQNSRKYSDNEWLPFQLSQQYKTRLHFGSLIHLVFYII